MPLLTWMAVIASLVSLLPHLLPSNYSLTAGKGILWHAGQPMLSSHSKPSKVFPSQIPKSLSIYRKKLSPTPGCDGSHYLPFCTLLTSLPPHCSLRTQSILPSIWGLWLRWFPSRRFFLQIISWLIPFFHANLCSNVTCSREAFSDYSVLTSPQTLSLSFFLFPA